MTYKEIMELLKEIQEDCRNRVMCNGCKFYSIEGCVLKHIPDQWNLELIYTFPKKELQASEGGISIEEFGEALEILEEGSFNNDKRRI